MAITNYSQLVKAVVSWSHREDLLELIPDFIMLAEDAMYNNEMQSLKLRSMEFTSTTTADSKVIALPPNFEFSRSTRLTINGGQLVYVTPESLNSVDVTGQPRSFTIIGDNIEFNRTPDSEYTLQLQYFRKELALTAANTTNNVLTDHPSVYLNGTILEAMIYAQDFDQQQIYRARFYNAIKGANRSDKKGRYGNAPSLKIDGGMHP
jgi:hypothetical protein